jgi:6-pyruvoyltetrahydropterin/6-carboxytetrahydropterin synthase
VFRVTRRYRFAASHRLHAAPLSEEENQRVYGKCNNPHGHGHNYVLEVSARGPLDSVTGRAVDPAALDRLVERQVVAPFDHRNLNVEAPAFASAVPTSENLALEIRRRLKLDWRSEFPGEWPKLDRVRIFETVNNIVEIGADEIQ